MLFDQQYWLNYGFITCGLFFKHGKKNIDQIEANLIEHGFNIFSHGQPDQIVYYVRANLPANHTALNYYVILTIALREKNMYHKRCSNQIYI